MTEDGRLYEVETPGGQVVALPAAKAREMLAAGLVRRIRPLGTAAWRVRAPRDAGQTWADGRVLTR